LVHFLWASDQPVSKASTAQDNTTQKDEFTDIYALRGILTNDLSFQVIEAYA
jgi:hypothetical protein